MGTVYMLHYSSKHNIKLLAIPSNLYEFKLLHHGILHHRAVGRHLKKKGGGGGSFLV